MQSIPDRYLTVLVEIEQSLLVCHDLHSCYDKILEQIGEIVNASHSYLVEIAEERAHPFSPPIAEWHAAQNACLHSLDWQALLPQTTISHWIARLRQGEMIVEAIGNLPGLPSEPQQSALHPPAVVLLPLQVQGQLYGAIGIEQEPAIVEGNPEPDLPTLQMLQGIAIALSLKLEQSQQQSRLKELSQQVQQLQNSLDNVAQQHTLQLQKSLNFEALLKRITDRVRDSLDQQQILQTAVQELAIGLGTYSCDAALYDLEQGTSTIAYEYLNSKEISSARGTFFQLIDYSDIYAQLLKGQPLQFCWVIPPTTPRGFKTRLVILGCPLIDDQGVIGDIWLYDGENTYFEAEEVRLIEQVANQCAIALRQARLYQEAQAQVQKLEHLNYLKDDFLNTVSHELRSPMANIEMAIQMLELLLFKPPHSPAASNKTDLESPIEQPSSLLSLQTSLPFAPPSKIEANYIPSPNSFQQALRYFRMLQDECVRETNLINDLLDLSRLEAGTEPLFLTTIHLQAWIPHVVEPFLERARSQKQHLQIDISEDLPPLPTDLPGLERIVSELLHNACKYTPAGEKICITARLESVCRESQDRRSLNSQPAYPAQPWKPSPLPAMAPMLFLRVSNSGVEIPPLELPRVFDKFYRIPSNDPWKHGGTGLGLALVKRLVDHLGATIEVESSHNQVMFTIAFLI